MIAVAAMQFLLQDAVRARLSKEAFDFGESRSAGSNAPYAMAAAQRLTADFGRLGSAADGLTYLDNLRHLLTGRLSLKSIAIMLIISLMIFAWHPSSCLVPAQFSKAHLN